MKIGVKKQVLLWIVAAVPLIMTAAVNPRLPEIIPIHWNIKGEVDGTAARFPGAFLLPAISLGVVALMLFIPRMDPRRENYKKFGGAYYWFMVALAGFFAVMDATILLISLGADLRVDYIMKLLVGVLTIIIGLIMPRLEHNYFIGIRTPWTYNSEKVWRATHRHGGRIWPAAGLAMCVLSFIPGAISAYVYFVLIAAAAIEPAVYSYIKYNKDIK